MTAVASIGQLLQQRALDDERAPFCFYEDEVITFGNVAGRVHRLAAGLRSIGIVKGSRVAVMLPNHPDHVYTMLATACVGATHVPVNIHLKSAGLEYLLNDARVEVLIGDARYARELAAAADRTPSLREVVWRGGAPGGESRSRSLEDLLAAQPDGHFERAAPEDVAVILYTSGTTGPPKGVPVTDRMYDCAARTAGQVAAVRDGDIMFLWEPLYHIAGVQTIRLCLQRGIACALVERFSASRFWEQVRRYGATQIHYLGGVVSLLMKQPPRPDDADNPARIAWGAATPVDMWRAFEQRFNVRIHECYGLTEGSSFTTMNLEGVPGSIGRPVDHFEVRIVDESGADVAPYERGEIIQRGREPGLIMTGYLNNPEATREALRDGWLHTGDVGYADDEGRLYFAGRRKERIRSRGENVSAWEVERAVLACPGVEECAVIGVASERGEDDIKLFVRRAENAQLTELDIVRFCEARLAYFQVPRYITFVAEFPKTPSERIRKDQLSRATDDAWDLDASGYRLERAR